MNVPTSELPLHHIEEVMNHCIHCGMCLPVCPTYAFTLKEESSPRGRIRLMRSRLEGTLETTKEFVDEMYFCLDCQACQTACPAGVQYGALVEDARSSIATEGEEPWFLRMTKVVLLRWILSSPAWTKFAGSLLRLYHRSGLFEAMNASHFLNVISSRLHQRHAMLPRISEQWFDESVGEVLPATGERRGTVGFLTGCIMNVAFSDVHHNAVEVLRMNGFDVVIPKHQVCCGSLHAHYGDLKFARSLARKNLDVFEQIQCDALVVDSAGCGAFLKEYGHILADDEVYAMKARTLAAKTKDITEFLMDVGLKIRASPLNYRVTYHEACHLVHTQKISRQPRDLISSIPGLDIVELPEATWCCGSAGMYNVLRFDDARKLLERKMGHIASTNAEIVLTANPGCHLQLQYGIKEFGLNMKVMHPVSLLYESYRNEHVLR